MFFLYAQSLADSFQSASTRRVLSASHTCGEVIGNQHYHIRLAIHAVQQSRHARMRERTIANHRKRRELSCIGSTFRHSDTRTHLHTCVDSMER